MGTNENNEKTALTEEELEDVNGGLSFGLVGNMRTLADRFGPAFRSPAVSKKYASLKDPSLDQLLSIGKDDARFALAQEFVALLQGGFGGSNVM